MLKTIVKEGESIERALKRHKRKFRNTKVLNQLRERQHYTKPSVAKRKAKMKAAHKEAFLRGLEE
ncbi:small subunit ribosomal protein S21 [Pustulibacterium marinum]|uniref:Small ribosomal subunit protein bS21 n=1 Tax=Pustulibacterium marinum TaxID=1224947 RepID=A0A1I7I641_9FLAO|nr:30S ribosomal protein S21 [Pustulibacterium marinum]SFU68402.1 small subunit ribosomal protein S21 [Pustulibacterium marinum]